MDRKQKLALNRDHLRRLVHTELRQAGVPPRAVFEQAREIIIFGSQAAGCAEKGSDLDVLCIGQGRRLKSPSLDLLWVADEMLGRPEWLGSELANHVAAFGVWIKGDGTWVSRVYTSNQAVHRKRVRVERKIEALKKYWIYLSRSTRRRLVDDLRLEARRLWYLRRGFAVPPAALLLHPFRPELRLRARLQEGNRP